MTEKKTGHEDLIHWVGDLFKNFPHLPSNIQDTLVKIAPVLALVFGILNILGGVAAVGISPVALFGGAQTSLFILISGGCAIAAGILMLSGYPHLTKHQYLGWKLLFWAEAVNVVSSLLSLSAPSILGVIIGFYLLYEIKERYQ